jgi:hypothetical protein
MLGPVASAGAVVTDPQTSVLLDDASGLRTQALLHPRRGAVYRPLDLRECQVELPVYSGEYDPDLQDLHDQNRFESECLTPAPLFTSRCSSAPSC